MTGRVLIAEPMSPVAAQVLTCAGLTVDDRPELRGADLSDIIGAYDGLVVRSGTQVDKQLIGHAERLRVIGRAGVGTDNIDVREAAARGVVGDEHAHRQQHRGGRGTPWPCCSPCAGTSRRPRPPCARDGGSARASGAARITGRNVGIVGMGNIGRIVADRYARPFGAQVLAYDPYLSGEAAESLGVQLVDLATLLRSSDFITLHTPLLPSTRTPAQTRTTCACASRTSSSSIAPGAASSTSPPCYGHWTRDASAAPPSTCTRRSLQPPSIRCVTTPG